MAGDHKCPVCQATFTRPQHVARHMRSHTGDRPYKCQHCGDQFARSDLLSRHINKCHANEKPPTTSNTRRKGAASACRATTSKQACDQCVQSSLPCDGANPCSKCIHRKCRCTYVKFHRQTAPQGPGHPSRPNDLNSLAPNLNALPSIPASFRLSDSFLLGPSAPAAPQPGAQGNTLYNHQFNFPPGTQLYSGAASGLDGSGLHLPGANLNRDSFENVADYSARYRAQADLLSRQGMIPSATELANGRSGSVGHAGMYADMQQHQPSQNPRYTGQQYGIQNDPSYPPNYDDNKLFPREGSEHYMPSQQLSNYGVNSGDTFNQSGVPISYIAEHRPHHLQHQPHRRGSTSLASDGGSSTSASHSQPSSAASSSVHLPISTDYQQQQHHGFPVDYAPSPVDGQRPPSHHGHPQQGQHPPQGDGEGGFSSAFGLMSLDDPNVLAGLTQGAPFFEHAMENGGSWSGDGITPRPGPTQSSHHEGNKDGNGNLPAATPSSLKELKEMWKQYMRTPFTGPLATPLAHTTSDQLAAVGGGLDPSLPRGSPKKERGLTRVASLPSVKTPDANNANGGGVGLRSLYNPEDLRSYEAAVLARKTPLNLNLQARRRGTLASVSISGSGGAGSGSGSSDGKSTSASPQHQPNASAMVAMGRPMPSQLAAMNVSRPSSSSSTSSLAHAFVVSSDGRSSESPAPGVYAHAPSPVMPPHAHGLPADGERDMRPSFKRLPSQTLVPDYSKRAAVHSQYPVQHLRGGGDDSALDERDGEDRVGGPMGPPPVAAGMGYAQRMSEAQAHAQASRDRARRMSAPGGVGLA